MARKSLTPAERPAAKATRLPEDVLEKAAALAVIIRVRKARGNTDGRRQKGKTRALLVRA